MKDLRSEFERFHAENPHVYQAFERFAMQASRSGRDRFSVSMIWERMRWYSQIETSDTEFKLNNNHRAFYARLFMELHPELGEFFETRRSRGDAKHEAQLDLF